MKKMVGKGQSVRISHSDINGGPKRPSITKPGQQSGDSAWELSQDTPGAIEFQVRGWRPDGDHGGFMLLPTGNGTATLQYTNKEYRVDMLRYGQGM